MIVRNVPTANLKPMGKPLTSKIFIKSAIDQTNLKSNNLKLGVVITWIISIVAIATCLKEADF